MMNTPPLEQETVQQQFETLLADISTSYINLPADHIDEFIEADQRRICTCLSLDLSVLWRWVDDTSDLLTITHMYSPPMGPERPEAIDGKASFPWTLNKLVHGETLVLQTDHMPQEAYVDKASRRYFGIQSSVNFPLSVGGGEVFGILSFDCLEKHDWSEKTVKRLSLVAQIFSNALVRQKSDRIIRDNETTLKNNQKDLVQLAGQLISTKENEMSRMARELHDDLSQTLAVLAIDVGKIELDCTQHGSQDLCLVEKLTSVKEKLIDVSDYINMFARQLHPTILDDLGLVRALESEFEMVKNSEGLDVIFCPENIPYTMEKEVSLCIYRITQESLHNIIKHSGKSACKVFLQGSQTTICLRISDTGTGFDPLQVREKLGLGLSSMRERAHLVGGKLRIETKPNCGTTVHVEIPLGITL